jgi:CHASE2 domain-containing sensor protein
MVSARTNPTSLRTSAWGAAVAVLAGLLLWLTPMGDAWVHASYDYLFCFGARPVTNNVSLILMDNAAFDHFQQTRGQPWSRGLHAQLLDKLAADGCSLVALDAFLRAPRDPAEDAGLVASLRRQQRVVLMAEQAQVLHPTLAGVQPVLPAPLFLNAAGGHWGVAWLDPDLDAIVRRQWPFPSPGPYPSLPWTAAQQLGAQPEAQPQERWLRYYGPNGGWTRLSYQYALAQPTNYFRNQIVFIGTWPKTSLRTDAETDKFCTPYSRWTGEASGGVAILLTACLNLLNHEWLQRPPGWLELMLFSASGILLGGGLSRLRLVSALGCSAGAALGLWVGAVCLSYFTAFWFPWLIIAGGQVPCALAWAVAVRLRQAPAPVAATDREPLPETPGYELLQPPLGEGAYGKVWLARTRAGQWRAVKAVYLARFGDDPSPYEREFSGVKKYQPISDRHPGLLRVEFVSEPKAGCFYYVMELGDSLVPGWEKNPAAYQPRDLVSERARLAKRRLPIQECVQLGITLCEALDFLHQQGMTHRDIKPQNIIFVHGRPKLADLGLITDIRPADQVRTLVGTPGYMPPSPERPGTVAADLYALGMVLYVSSTGRAAALFPEIATTLVSVEDDPPEFLVLNTVILKACEPLPANRYASAAAMRAALQAVQRQLTGQKAGG